MKNLLIAILLSGAVAHAQETKKVTVKNKNPIGKEVFYVLKSDKSIKHGSYKKFSFNDNLVVEGFYKDGRKDSIWTEYSEYSGKKSSSGTYVDNAKYGVWSYYNYKGVLEQKYNHSTQEVEFYEIKDEEADAEYKVIEGSDTLMTQLERPPLYIGGSSVLNKGIWSNIKYPSEAKAKGISGKIYISFTVDAEGNMSDFKVSNPTHELLDNEALRVVKLIPNKWVPARLNGKEVKVLCQLPINFVLR